MTFKEGFEIAMQIILVLICIVVIAAIVIAIANMVKANPRLCSSTTSPFTKRR